MNETHGTAKMIRHAFSLRREGHGRDALVIASAALKTCPPDDTPMLVEIYACLGQLHRDAGRHEDALHWYGKASAATGNRDRYFHLLRHVADIQCELGRYAEADESYPNILAHYGSEQSLNRANALRGYALVQEGLGQTEGARKAWQAARDLYQQFGIAAGVEECDQRLVNLS
ncbi:MAG: hypothetical protein R3330_16520 [Saprospiraceae bacterium]|nr:hypothetical protein [Saprospiraceae bacterium]